MALSSAQFSEWWARHTETHGRGSSDKPQWEGPHSGGAGPSRGSRGVGDDYDPTGPRRNVYERTRGTGSRKYSAMSTRPGRQPTGPGRKP